MWRVRLVAECAAIIWTAVGASPSAAADRIEAFQADRRLVATYYCNGYMDGAGLKEQHSRPHAIPRVDSLKWAWAPYYPKSQEPGAGIFGLNDPGVWPRRRLPDTSKWPDSDDWQYHAAELRAMKWAGVDFAFVNVWWPTDFTATSTADAKGIRKPATPVRGVPCRELAALFQAWRYLDQRNESPVRLAVSIQSASFQKLDLRATGGQPARLFEPVWAFFRQFLGEGKYQPVMPRRALAAIADRRGRACLVVNFTCPRDPTLPTGDWIARWDAGTFADLRYRFEGMAGAPLYICVNQHPGGPKAGGWNGVQADGTIVDISRYRGVVEQEITQDASLAGPQMRDDSIAIGVGRFRFAAGERRPGTGTDSTASASADCPLAYRYFHEDQAVSSYELRWQQVVASPESFKKHLLVIESWNDLLDGSHVSPSRPSVWRDAQGTYIDRWGDSPTMYLELTRKYVELWRGPAPAATGAGGGAEAAKESADTSPPGSRKARKTGTHQR